MNSERGLIVFVVIRLHRFDQAYIIHSVSQIWEQIAHECAALATRFEVPERLEQDPLLIREPATNPFPLAVGFEQLRLVIERVHVGHATVRKNEDYPLGSRWEMRGLGRKRIGGHSWRARFVGEQLRDQARHEHRTTDQALYDSAPIHCILSPVGFQSR